MFFKRKRIVQIDKEKYEIILSNMVVLLKKSPNTFQANWVEQIIHALKKDDQEEFMDKLISAEMWGGSGSVWEVGGFYDGEDYKQFAIQIVKLVDLLKESGIRSKAARSAGRVLKKMNNI
ncbi:hypothetical protein [Aureitalea marina]|uniref:Uncharacterized protein n=1 Tax=Aureitalea marina TaxID=930804 RepID=A0A2S7KP09_9FLAO|nr:hypothetical protein [Aureitalea marina]PQB04340.1 hypothetical protein BST85_05075 [Aureitalea marina]